MQILNAIIQKTEKIASRLPIIGKHITEEFVRFLIIGTTSFLIFYALNNSIVFTLDHFLDPASKTVRGLIVWNSYITAYLLAFVYNFSLSRNWTFKEKLDRDIVGMVEDSQKKEIGCSPTGRITKQISKFFIVNAFNAFSGAIFVTILDYAGVPPWASQPIFIGVQTIWTYLLYKKWVFTTR